MSFQPPNLTPHCYWIDAAVEAIEAEDDEAEESFLESALSPNALEVGFGHTFVQTQAEFFGSVALYHGGCFLDQRADSSWPVSTSLEHSA